MARPRTIDDGSSVDRRIGRYRIVGKLGQGSMGTIYLGRAEGVGRFERLMAIKMIHPHLAKQKPIIEMFLDEARVAALIRHPNLVPVFEIGEHDGSYFVAMEYVSGEPLSVFLDENARVGAAIDSDLAAYVMAAVCEALHGAHEMKDAAGRTLDLVHRDICPQNIMLGYDGIVRVMDFGVAKTTRRIAKIESGTYKGRTAYSSPEQIRSGAIDRRSDIFSAGVVLWESTVGKRLFKGEDDTATAANVLEGAPRPSSARKPYPSNLESIVLKALSADPAQRYQTAREMELALRKYLARRSSMLSASDLERILKSVCRAQFEDRVEMERRAHGTSTETVKSDDQLPAWEPPRFDLMIGPSKSVTSASNALMQLAAEELVTGRALE